MTVTRSSLASPDILAFLETRSGLVFPKGRISDVERSLAKAAQRAGVRDPHRLLERLQADAGLFEELMSDLVVGETYFFREPQQFESLRQMVLPDLLRHRPLDASISVWSAGCATGEEAYSLAILLEQEGLSQRSEIVATDISATALRRAADAIYENWSFRGAKEDFAKTYFRARRGKLHLVERIRDAVSFSCVNLAGQTYPRPRHGGFDLILCRNVLIYFGAQTVGEVARRLFDSLADGGWLVTAPSDPPLWDFAPFETRMTAGGVFYHKKRAILPKRKPSNVIPFRRRVAEPAYEPRKPSARAMKTPGPDFRHDVVACEAHAQVLFAENRSGAVLEFLARAVVWHPLSRELHYLYAVGLLNGDKLERAAEIARRLVYLDRRSVAAHMLLGTIAQQRGDYNGAMRAYRNGLAFCGDAGEDEIVPLTGNERYGRLAAALAAEIAALQSAERAS
jgi:chemotaxis protein methyltransferase CheR